MGLITTFQASCRDCYKCVRSCPVKAIKIHDGHAEVVENRCIADGRCVKICPQNAKRVKNSIDLVTEFIHSGSNVAVSLAPSFVGAFSVDDPRKIVTVLKKLGFTYIAETAEGAAKVAEEHRRLLDSDIKPLITSCCPAVVNLIEIYYPQFLTYLAPIVSPMIAHGKILKQRYGFDTKVVFIGPCIAKKGEEQSELVVDAILTFQELAEMFHREEFDLSRMEATEFDNPSVSNSRTFPLPGGLARSASLTTDLLAKEIVTIDGLDEVIEFLDQFDGVKDSLRLVELLACRGGCITGPEINNGLTPFTRRNNVIQFAEERIKVISRDETEVGLGTVNLQFINQYRCRVFNQTKPSEAKIQSILNRTGKVKPEDELNCGACGYNSCRDKAMAVALGMAEVDMCIPYMRSRAESKANIICQMTPNAIFVVNRSLRILELNPAAESKFQCQREQMVGKRLSTLMDPQYFEAALNSKKLVTGEVDFASYGIVTWQAIFYVEHDDILIGIFADITQERKQQEQLSRVTDETLQKAQEVINKQMKVAQEIAGLLGETTAETKVQLTKLMNLIRNEGRKVD